MNNLADIVVAIDTGRSSTKVAMKIKPSMGPMVSIDSFIFENYVCDWDPLKGAEDETIKNAEAETISVSDKKYFVGETARVQGKRTEFFGQNPEWINSSEHDALVAFGFKKAIDTIIAYGYKINLSVVCLGLPASQIDKKEILVARIKSALEPIKNQYGLQIIKTLTTSQARAPILLMSFNEQGVPTGRFSNDDSLAVVEIGHFTTDFCIMDSGKEVVSASESFPGVRSIYNDLSSKLKARNFSALKISVIEKALRDKVIRQGGNEYDVADVVGPIIHAFESSLINNINSRMGDSLDQFTDLLIAGGGAEIVGETLAKEFGKKVVIVDNPRFSVAEGLARFGLFKLAASA
jgi:plasmid segregation protein ParM